MNKNNTRPFIFMPSEAQVSKLLGERAWCYFIPPQEGRDGFVPALVIERVRGYRMMEGRGEGAAPWNWGETEAKANEVCQEMNARRGITPERQQQIVLSTMADF